MFRVQPCVTAITTCLIGWVGWSNLALAASPVDRVKGVSTFAKKASSSGPDHLLVGLAAVAGCALIIIIAMAMRKKGKRTR